MTGSGPHVPGVAVSAPPITAVPLIVGVAVVNVPAETVTACEVADAVV